MSNAPSLELVEQRGVRGIIDDEQIEASKERDGARDLARSDVLAATSSIARLRATILSYLAEARTDRAAVGVPGGTAGLHDRRSVREVRSSRYKPISAASSASPQTPQA